MKTFLYWISFLPVLCMLLLLFCMEGILGLVEGLCGWSFDTLESYLLWLREKPAPKEPREYQDKRQITKF